MTEDREACRQLGSHDMPDDAKPGDVHICPRCGVERKIMRNGSARYKITEDA